jgi:hypothetical protein
MTTTLVVTRDALVMRLPGRPRDPAEGLHRKIVAYAGPTMTPLARACPLGRVALRSNECLLPLCIRNRKVPAGARIEPKDYFAAEFPGQGVAQPVAVVVAPPQMNILSAKQGFGLGLELVFQQDPDPTTRICVTPHSIG